MLKAESFPIEKIYVPVKRRKALNSDVVQEIAQSILEIGQQAPILIRPDEDRFVLDAFVKVRKDHNCRLLLAPRSLDRPSALRQEIESRGLTVPG